MKNYLRSANRSLTKLFTIAILLTSFALSRSYGQSVSFSGTWTLDKQQTDFAGQPQWVVPVKYIVDEKDDRISVEKSIINDQSQELRPKVELPFDGSPIEITNSNGSKAVETCSKDAQQNIHISIVLPQPDGEDHVTEDWSLSNDKQKLLITRTMLQSNGLSYKIKAVYDK